MLLDMNRLSPRVCNNCGLSSTVSVVLVILLVIALAVVIGSIVFGTVVLVPKSAYIAVQTEVKNTSSGNWYLSVFNRNGDAAYLNITSSAKEGMPVDFQFTNSTYGTVIPFTDPSDGPETWKSGDTLFVYSLHNITDNSDRLGVTKNETRAITATMAGTGLPKLAWRFDVVDRTDDVIIYTEKLGVGVPTPTVSPTPTGAPTVTGRSPISGPAGTSVAITGTGFVIGSTTVKFGGTAATTFTVNSATSITANSPAGGSGLVDITVTTPGGTSATSSNDQYTYTAAAPTVTSINPPTGPKGKLLPITIGGTNFKSGATVTVSQNSDGTGYILPLNPFSVDSTSQISGTLDITQGHPNIFYYVSVLNTDGQKGTSTTAIFEVTVK